MTPLGLPIPTPSSLDPAFLTAVLESLGHRVTVSGLKKQRIGTGQIGQCLRCTLSFDSDPGTAPRSLIAKFASDDETSRQTGVVLRNFLKEVRFYQQLQPRVSIRTPICYYAEIEDSGPNFALLLEDLAPAEQGNQIEGCDQAVAAAAVNELIGLHAPTWNDVALQGVDWLGTTVDPERPKSQDLYNQVLNAFFDRLGSRLTADEVDIIERVAASSGPPWQTQPAPFSLVHSDYRLDNLMIHQAPTAALTTVPDGEAGAVDGQAVTVVDWQTLTVGNPLADVAYFLGAGLVPELRRNCDEGIVRRYHQALTAYGVPDYDWQQCWNDYRRGAFAGFAVTVIGSILVVETERGNDMFTTMAKRHARHAIDLGSAEFL